MCEADLNLANVQPVGKSGSEARPTPPWSRKGLHVPIR